MLPIVSQVNKGGDILTVAYFLSILTKVTAVAGYGAVGTDLGTKSVATYKIQINRIVGGCSRKFFVALLKK